MEVVATGAVSANWRSVLELLGSPVPREALPLRTQCPACAAPRLQVHEDRICGGVWYHCPDCHLCGDALDIAARTWECSRELAERKLGDAGLVVEGGQGRVRSVAEARALFDDVKKRFAFRPETTTVKHRRLLGQLGVPLIQDRTWLNGPGRMLLACHRQELDALLAPGLVGDRSVLEGRGWRELILAPFEDLPGRTCGLVCGGREGRAADRRYVSVRPYTHRGTNEAGLAGLWCLSASERVLGEHVVAVSDVFLAARIHARQANLDGSPLPLIAYHDGGRFRTQNAWQCLDGRTPVLWGPRLDAALLHQAEACNGLISLMRIESVSADSITRYIRQAEPVALLLKALWFARPWREALITWADTVSDIEVEELLLGMEGYPGPLSRLGISPRLGKLLARRRCASRVWINEHLAVTEREGRWYGHQRGRAKQSESLILNAILRVDRLGRKGSAGYECRLIHEGDEIPVTLSLSHRERDGERLRAALFRAKGAALHVEPGWGSYLVQAAMRFAPLADAA